MNKLIIALCCLLFSVSGIGAEKVALPLEDFDNWYYKKSEQYQGWKYIVLHHSATNAGSVNAFHKFHTKQGYGVIAYHFVIGICLVGNLEKQKPTQAQLVALKMLIRRLRNEYKITANNVVGHRHVSYDDEPQHTEKTACPGKKLRVNSVLSSASK